MSIGFIAVSYENGKLSDIKFTNKSVPAGRVTLSDNITLRTPTEDSEIKALIWDMNTLQPIDKNSYYSDILPTH